MYTYILYIYMYTCILCVYVYAFYTHTHKYIIMLYHISYIIYYVSCIIYNVYIYIAIFFILSYCQGTSPNIMSWTQQTDQR